MTQVQSITSFSSRKAADALILPFFEKQKPAFTEKGLASHLSSVVKDFTGQKGEVICYYPSKGKEKRILFVGLGDEHTLTGEDIRRSFANAIHSIKAKVKSVNVVIPESKRLTEEEIFTAAVEGTLLANHVFDLHKSKKEKTISHITFISKSKQNIKELHTIIECVFFAREMIIDNADDVTPTFLAKKAQELAKAHSSIKTTVLHRRQIEEKKLGLLAAVARSSAVEPALIIIEYKGDPRSKRKIGLAGKGITFDTGGLNLKPTGGMETMRDDMSGAAAVLGTLRAVTALKLPINIVAVIASTENAIGSKSYKPGDIYRSHAGINVEISNTDAEGRLVLADALSYLQEQFDLEQMIDIGTLTGGAIVALGEEVAALMSNNDALAKKLLEAGEKTYERLWRMPLYEEYKDLLKSSVADIKNAGVRKASSIQAAMFLQEFIKKPLRWAHIDIAGVAFPEQRKSYQPIQATGFGVRLLVEFFKQVCEKATS